MKQTKYGYLVIIQGHYGNGWEDLACYETWKSSREDFRLYQENEPTIPHRRINRRVLRTI